MAEVTAIEWADSTFNPWMGCTKVSPACDHCYAETLMDKRHHRVKWGPHGERVRTSESNWQNPRRWQRQAAAFFAEHGRRRRVFCASLADVFDNKAPTGARDDLWTLIRETPGLDWLLLTKRPQNIAKMLPAFWPKIAGHVWLGTSTENQEEANRRLSHLLSIEPRPAVFFASAEPLLGPIDFKRWCPTKRMATLKTGERALLPHFFMTNCEHCGWIGSSELCGTDVGFDDSDVYCPACDRSILGDDMFALDWVIAGGESGPGARPTHPDWVRSIRDQCAAAGVAFLFKQHGEWAPRRGAEVGDIFNARKTVIVCPGGGITSGLMYYGPDAWVVDKVGKKAAGRTLDGVTHDGFPQVAL
jgi:protein gp37